jgi:ElaB/YqjD/DUF883 family membrane-anchored ribosome-binding protein
MISNNADRADQARNVPVRARRGPRDSRSLRAIAAERIEEGADRLKARGRRMVADGRETVERYQDHVERYIADHPYKSLLVAVGVGTLLGLVLRRRS